VDREGDDDEAFRHSSAKTASPTTSDEEEEAGSAANAKGAPWGNVFSEERALFSLPFLNMQM